MNLDLRFPIGLMFSLFGLLLTGYGIISPTQTQGININLWWGLVMLVFGLLMLWLGWRGQTKNRD